MDACQFRIVGEFELFQICQFIAACEFPLFESSSSTVLDAAALFVFTWRVLFEQPSLPEFLFYVANQSKHTPNHAMQLTGSARHGSCSPQTRRAATAPRSACS